MFKSVCFLLFAILYIFRSSSAFSPAIEDSSLTVPEIIKKNGYPCEEHQVVTADGYILTLHRIPHGQNSKEISKKVVYVTHGLLISSADFIIAGPERGLGYILANRGYDVWLSNARGNKYSRNHTTLDPDSSEFWKFSWHEIGIYDLPASIDYILEKTGVESLLYVGYSQGTTAFYVMASMLPQYNQKIKAQFSMAPSAFQSHMKSPLLRVLSYWTAPMELLKPLIGYDEFMPSTRFLRIVGGFFCGNHLLTQPLCTNLLFLLFGFSYEQFDETMLTVIRAHTPAGASTNQVLHYRQGVVSGHFRQYDFTYKNFRKYGSFSPPDYNLSAITTPVYLLYARNDWLESVEDVLKLSGKLGNRAGMYEVPISFNHMDFIYAKEVKEHVYEKLINWMDEYS